MTDGRRQTEDEGWKTKDDKWKVKGDGSGREP